MVRCLGSDFWRCCHRVEPRSSSCLASSCTVAVETDMIVRPILVTVNTHTYEQQILWNHFGGQCSWVAKKDNFNNYLTNGVYRFVGM